MLTPEFSEAFSNVQCFIDVLNDVTYRNRLNNRKKRRCLLIYKLYNFQDDIFEMPT